MRAVRWLLWIACAGPLALAACGGTALGALTNRGETSDAAGDVVVDGASPAPDAGEDGGYADGSVPRESETGIEAGPPDAAADERSTDGEPDASPDAVPGETTCGGDACVLEVAAGAMHSCARFASGHVRCWGLNRSGELGTGTVVDMDRGAAPHVTPQSIAMPTEVAGITEATHLAVAGATDYDISNFHSFSCALLPGKVECWGSSYVGELGRGDLDGGVKYRAAYPTPSAVMVLDDPVQLVAGNHMACAVSGAGNLACWGQLQLGYQLATSPQAIELPGTRALEVSVGGRKACVLLDDSSVACWAETQNGLYVAAPRRVELLPPIAHVSAGGMHQCVLSQEGTIYCWGLNGAGQLGHAMVSGVPEEDAPSLVALPHGKTALQVVAGTYATCALLSDRTVACWGDNLDGVVGAGTLDSETGAPAPRFVPTPTVVEGLSEVRQLSMNGDAAHICALTISGKVLCWGQGAYGQLGPNYTPQPGTRDAQLSPLDVPLP
jgi:alpha-tubulin suppressor-like RCC1 family protein